MRRILGSLTLVVALLGFAGPVTVKTQTSGATVVQSASPAQTASPSVPVTNSYLDSFLKLLDAISKLAWPLLAAALLWKLYPVLRKVFESRSFAIKVAGIDVSVQDASEQLAKQIQELQDQFLNLRQQFPTAFGEVKDTEPPEVPPQYESYQPPPGYPPPPDYPQPQEGYPERPGYPEPPQDYPERPTYPEPPEGYPEPPAYPEPRSPAYEKPPESYPPPGYPQPPTADPPSVAYPKPTSPGARRKHILWVDDNPSNNAFIIDKLGKDGVEVTEALSTREALTFLGKNTKNIDVIISDMGRFEDGQYQPNAGLKLIEAMRDLGIPIFVFSSAQYAREHGETVRTAGAKLVTSSSLKLLEGLKEIGVRGSDSTAHANKRRK